MSTILLYDVFNPTTTLYNESQYVPLFGHFYRLRSKYNSFQFSASLIMTLVLILTYYSSGIWYANFCRNRFFEYSFYANYTWNNGMILKVGG